MLIQDAGISGNSIENSQSASGLLTLNELWSKVPSDLLIPTEREIFLGFDYDATLDKLVCTEQTPGARGSVKPSKHHLVMLHTEPFRTQEELSLHLGPFEVIKASRSVVFANNLPTPYVDDIYDILKDPSIAVDVIIRLGLGNDLAAALVVVRTKASKDITLKLADYELMHHILNERNPVKQALGEDRVASQAGGFALYRGFIHIPPQENEVLRLRKFD